MLKKALPVKFAVLILLMVVPVVLASISIVCASKLSFDLAGVNNSAGLKAVGWEVIYLVLLPAAEILSIILSAILAVLHLRTKNRESAENVGASGAVQEHSVKPAAAEVKPGQLSEAAVKSDTAEMEFFSNMLHELKTPLSVILGAVQLIEKNGTFAAIEDRKLTRHLQIIKQNTYRLIRLLNNLLDMAKVDSGYSKANRSECNIVYLIEEIVQSVIPYAEHKQLSLEFDTDTEEIYTAVDMDKIERIMLNLLSNAIKFTERGGNIQVKTAEINDAVIITVKDSGVGIPKDKQDLIFERFRQLDNRLYNGAAGSGIGLSIVKSFVELHSGKIKVNSEENKGSEFIIELPVLRSETDSKPEKKADNDNSRIVEALKIEFSDIYSVA